MGPATRYTLRRNTAILKKIFFAGGAQSDQQQDATEQLNKILSTLKVPVTSSAAAAKPFSLTDFLASNSGPTHGEMYPMYGSPTVLLRPEILKSPGNTSVVYSSNPGAPITSGQPERKVSDFCDMEKSASDNNQTVSRAGNRSYVTGSIHGRNR